MKRLTLMAAILVTLGLAFVVMGLAARSSSSSAWVNQPLPRLELQYLGQPPELTGKPLIVEFWATWCGPCRTSIPHLNEIYQRYKSRGLVVVGITNEDPNTITDFTRQVPIDYSVAVDAGGKLSRQLGITGIPHAFLVNKAGRIVWEGHPMELTDADLEKILE